MRRSLAGGLVIVLLVSSISIGAAAATTHVAIESVTTSVDTPAPEEPFTTTITVANRQTSSGPVELTDLFIRSQGDGITEHVRAEDLGTISVGGQLSVPLTVEFAEPGEKRLTVSAVVKDADGNYSRYNYPLFVTVEEPDEAIVSVADLEPVAGEESSFNVTVSNGETNPLSNVRLDIAGDGRVTNPERVTASLQAGTQTTHRVEITFPESGEQDLTIRLSYTTSSGNTRTVQRTITTDVAAAEIDPELTATPAAVDGAPVIRATLTEYGNVELQNVQLQARVDGEVVARTMMSDVPAENARTVTFDGSRIPAGDVTIVAAFTAAGEQRTVRQTIQYAPTETSNVVLTGVDLTVENGILSVSGDAANTGSADVQSVLVSVVETDDVQPVVPNKEYFVGTVGSSEFATFELTANVSKDVTTLPVQITYSVNGERVSHITNIDTSAVASQPSTDQGPQFSDVIVIGALAVLGVVLVAAIVLSRRRP
jgi:hypothetical protein